MVLGVWQFGYYCEQGVLAALPGITGLAQMRAIDMSDPKLCAETDAEYLKTASIGLDIRILIGTIF